MNWTDRRDRLRAIAAGDRCIFPASVYDGISARIAGDLGFEVLMFAGSVASATVLAAPDNCTLTLTEFAAQALRINRVASLPLLVDADHGYGNALNAKRTVEELETAGVSGLTIEDTLLPTPFRGGDASALIPIPEGVGKMRAAIAGRQDPRLVIVGRTSAITLSSLADAIARIQAYEAAGVDMLFLADVSTRAMLDEIAGAVNLPLFLGSVPDDMKDAAYLASRKVRICLQSHNPFWASVNGVYEALKSLSEGVHPRDLKAAPPALRKKVLRDADYDGWQKDFLS